MTVLVWLLISLPGYSGSAPNPSNHHPVIVERFLNLQECQRVGKIIKQNTDSYTHKTMCIQARIFVKE